MGFVHFSGALGDKVRNESVLRFLRDAGIDVVEFRLRVAKRVTDRRPAALSLATLADIGRKVVLKRPLSVINEMNWRAEAELWERSVDEAARDIANGLSGVDVLHAETVFGGLACVRLQELTQIPFILDMHGIAHEEAKLVHSPAWEASTQRWESLVVPAAERVIVVSPLMADYVARVYSINPDHIVVAPNGSYFTEQQAVFRMPLTVLFAGNFAPFENVMEVVRTAEMNNGRREHWLVGDGSMRSEVFDYVNSRGAEVLYWGRRSREKTMALMARAQVGFSGQSGARDLRLDYPRQLGCPIKLFDYASCGLPIVAPPGEWSSLIENADCGAIASGPSAEAFDDAIRSLEDPAVWERKSRNAKALIANGYQWFQVLSPLPALYK